MPVSGTNIFQGWLQPYSGGRNPAGLIIEIIKLAAGTSDVIYAASNASVDVTSCQKIETIICGIPQCEADDADHTLADVTSTTTEDDTLTVTSVASVAKTVLVFGRGMPGTIQ